MVNKQFKYIYSPQIGMETLYNKVVDNNLNVFVIKNYFSKALYAGKCGVVRL